MLWLIVFCRKEAKYVKELKGREIIFLVKLSLKACPGLLLLTAGTILMAVFI